MPPKRTSLATAIRRHVRPGMHLHFASSPSRSNASIREVARHFRGTRPAFTLSATGFHSTAHLLALLRLGERYISCFFGDNYPTPRPNPLYATVEAEGARLEHWSLGAYVAALRAGGLGQPCAVTRSLVGTSLGAELGKAGRFWEMPDPDGGERNVGIVRAMRPDVAFFHAFAATEDGTFIASPPHGEGFWSAFAAREGCIVTVERLGDRALVERSSDWIKVPSYRVLAVCEEPFGAHPQPLYVAPRDPSVAGYLDDFEHYELWQRMTTDAALFADFLQRVLGAHGRAAAYRTFVGEARLAGLGAAARTFFEGQAGRARPGLPASSETCMRAARPLRRRWATSTSARAVRVEDVRTTCVRSSGAPGASTSLMPNQRLVLLAARAIARRVAERDHHAILAGIGASFAAARVAKLLLESQGRKVEVMVETGLVDVECGKSAHSFLLAWQNVAQAARLSSIEDVLGTLTCGAENRCLAVIGAAEVDVHGAVNSTRLASGELLVGSGGANDIASSCSDVVVVVRCDRERLVPRVHHVTSPGRAVMHVATERCILSRRDQAGVWSVSDVYPDGFELNEELAAIRARCGFPDLETVHSAWAELPSAIEREALAALGEPPSRPRSQNRVGGA